jgi:ubiquinone/menaquinone biosynthesis C-methylase UbiE
MALYRERVLPRLIDLTLRGRPIERLRQAATAGLDGEVLEIGFGSGRNVPHYPGTVRRMLAVEPSTVGRRLAAERVGNSRVPIEYIGLDGEDLPLDDQTIDHVLTTFTLCTIPDAERALREARRVLRPGGELHFVEHGLAPDPAVARWQDRLEPLQRRIAGGCHLTRPIDKLLRSAGLDIVRLDNRYLSRPRALSYLYVGVARRPA